MVTLIFILPDHKTTWSQSVPGVPALTLARQVRQGEWRMPAAWRQSLARDHGMAGRELELELRVHSNCVVLIGHRRGERVPVSQAGLVRRLARGSARMLRERLTGATIKAINYRSKRRHAWTDRLMAGLMRQAVILTANEGK